MVKRPVIKEIHYESFEETFTNRRLTKDDGNLVV